MADPGPDRRTAQRANRFIQWVLRGGLIGSTMLIVAGLAIVFVTGHYTGSAVRLVDLTSDASFSDRIVAIGLVVLALTPLARVVALSAVWTRHRDLRFVALSVVVAAILVASIISGWRSNG